MATTWTAWRLMRMTQAATNDVFGYLAAGLFLTVSLVIDITSAVMLDVVVAALAIEATYWLSRFVDSERTGHALAFGLMAALCCLTKGNGISIVLIPGLTILLTGRYRLLKHKGLWWSAAIVVLLALPLVLVSFRLDSGMGGYSPVPLAQVVERTQYYSSELWVELGSLMVVFAIVGMVARGNWFWLRQGEEKSALIPAMTSLVVAGLLFHIFNPVEVYDKRYVALVVAPAIALFFVGVEAVSPWLSSRRLSLVRATICAAAIANFAAVKPAIAFRGALGYREAAAFLENGHELAGRRILIVSNETGEGAFVAEVAARAIAPSPTVIRGSKLIASDDWNGQHFRMNFSTASDLAQELSALHVDFVLIDQSVVMPYTRLLQDTLSSYPDRLQRIREIHGQRDLVMYRAIYTPVGPAKKVEAEVAALRRVLRER
jgi:hypothetical protein